VVICLERGADVHIVQLMPLPLTVSCSSKIQIGFTFLVPAHLGSPGKGPLNGCVCVSVTVTEVVHRLLESVTPRTHHETIIPVSMGRLEQKCFQLATTSSGATARL